MTNLGQTNCDEFVDNFVIKKAGQSLLTVHCVIFNLTWFDDCSFLFLHTYFNNDSISEIQTSPVATVGIRELSLSKCKYETLQISKDFIKFSVCQVPLRKFKPPLKTFWRRFWFLTPHLFTRQFSCIRFLPAWKSKKHANREQFKSSRRFSIGFRVISRLGCAFFFLWCFKIAHICIQVTSLYRCNKQGNTHRFLSLAYFTCGVKLHESWT